MKPASEESRVSELVMKLGLGHSRIFKTGRKVASSQQGVDRERLMYKVQYECIQFLIFTAFALIQWARVESL